MSSQLLEQSPATTAGVIGVRNLGAQIDGQVARATRGELAVGERAELIEQIALRGHVLGSIADSDRAAAMAEELVAQAAGDARSYLARARMRGVFHEFAAALEDLAHAGALKGEQGLVEGERAAIYQALGQYDAALFARQQAFHRQPEFGTMAALGGVYGERGEMETAERWFDRATRSYRSTSPFPLAMLEFQRGKLWMEREELHRARSWFEAAIRRLPAYVPAHGHLAELDAARGKTVPAIARLRTLAWGSDDPDYATQLARILRDVRQVDEAALWRARAEARYEDLLTRHLDAFADHGAEFWLRVGGDPGRALALAQHNLAVRPTPRARALYEAAAKAHSA